MALYRTKARAARHLWIQCRKKSFFFYLMSQEIGHENKNVDLFLCMLYGTSPIGHRCEEAVLDYELMLSVRLCGINS